MRTLHALLAVAALSSGGAVPAAAQGTHVGIHAVLALVGVGIGLQAHAPIAGPVELYPSYDRITTLDAVAHVGNLDFKIAAPTGSGYVGAGVSYLDWGDCADCQSWGGNVFFGFESRAAATHPHVEVRLKPHYTFEGWSMGLMISGGLNFRLF